MLASSKYQSPHHQAPPPKNSNKLLEKNVKLQKLRKLAELQNAREIWSLRMRCAPKVQREVELQGYLELNVGDGLHMV
jgi:hypothetical protein